MATTIILIINGSGRFSINPLIIMKPARPNTSRLAPICNDDRPIIQSIRPPNREIEITIDRELALDPANNISKTSNGTELLSKCPQLPCKKCMLAMPISPPGSLGTSPNCSNGKKRSRMNTIQINAMKPTIQPSSLAMLC